jgi:pSer/pThr/pTyr-binding forkhead associated (FHA) protein
MSDTPRPRLEVRSGQGIGLTFALATSPIVIGRDPSALIRLDDYSVSWKHAQLREQGGRFWVSDLNSGYGTFVGGARLTAGQELPLDEGAVLKVGDTQLAFTTRPVRPSHLRSPESMLPAQPAASPAPARGSAAPPSVLAQAVAPRRARVTIRAAMGQSPPTELGDRMIVGNQPGACQMLVPDPTIAPQHLELSRHPDGFYARDLSAALGPTYGTFRQGQPLTSPTRLTHGDVLTLGRSVTLLYEEAR